MRTTFIAVLLSSCICLAGCGGGMSSSLNPPDPAPIPPASATQPQIVLTATPATVEPGASATLSWSTQNASRVTIAGLGQQPQQGSLKVSPSVDDTYTATAWNGSVSRSASVTVRVTSAKSIVAVNMSGPDNYYFTPSPLADSLSLYGINPSTGALTYLGGSQDADLFTNAAEHTVFASGDGRWIFVQAIDGPIIEFSTLNPSNFEASRRQVASSNYQLVGSDPVSNFLVAVRMGTTTAPPELVGGTIQPDGGVQFADEQSLSFSQLSSPAVFDATGKYFLFSSQLYRVGDEDDRVSPIGTPGPNSIRVIGFDQNDSHIIAHTTVPTSSGYLDQISVYDLDAETGNISLNNSNTSIPGRVADYTLFGFSGNVLWAMSGGVMTSYSFNPTSGMLSQTGTPFNVSEDFQVPFVIDPLTNTIVQPAAQANQVNSYSVNPVSGSSSGSHGPYQAGTAPWALAIAHVQ